MGHSLVTGLMVTLSQSLQPKHQLLCYVTLVGCKKKTCDALWHCASHTNLGETQS